MRFEFDPCCKDSMEQRQNSLKNLVIRFINIVINILTVLKKLQVANCIEQFKSRVGRVPVKLFRVIGEKYNTWVICHVKLEFFAYKLFLKDTEEQINEKCIVFFLQIIGTRFKPKHL